MSYIEREAAIFSVKAHYPKEADTIASIVCIPAADVRPVVTCADCKFWDRERISCEGLARCNTGESGVRYRNRNDFCSRGEKREES
jgi:hypothetical protein